MIDVPGGWIPDNDRVILALWLVTAVMFVGGVVCLVVGGLGLHRLWREEDAGLEEDGLDG